MGGNVSGRKQRVEGRDATDEKKGREQTIVSFRGYFKHMSNI